MSNKYETIVVVPNNHVLPEGVWTTGSPINVFSGKLLVLRSHGPIDQHYKNHPDHIEILKETDETYEAYESIQEQALEDEGNNTYVHNL